MSLQFIIMFLFFGCVVTLVSLYDLIRIKSIIKNGEQTNAVVVEIVKERSSGKYKYDVYRPILKYNANGIEYKTKYDTNDRSPKYADGSSRSIIYHKKNPKKILVTDDIGSDTIHYIFIGVGVVFMGAGLFFLFTQ